MGKNELRAMARIALIGVGLYVLMQALLGTMSAVPLLLTVAHDESMNPFQVFLIILYIVLLLAIIYFLFRFADHFSAKIVAPEPPDDAQISWLAIAFRLICVTAGLVFLYWTGYSAFATLVTYSTVKSATPHSQYTSEIVKCVILLILSIYLVCGAPGFVRWQVRRTLKACGKSIEQEPTWR